MSIRVGGQSTTDSVVTHSAKMSPRAEVISAKNAVSATSLTAGRATANDASLADWAADSDAPKIRAPWHIRNARWLIPFVCVAVLVALAGFASWVWHRFGPSPIDHIAIRQPSTPPPPEPAPNQVEEPRKGPAVRPAANSSTAVIHAAPTRVAEPPSPVRGTVTHTRATPPAPRALPASPAPAIAAAPHCTEAVQALGLCAQSSPVKSD